MTGYLAIEQVTAWVWETSWQASVLVAIVLIVQRVFRRWLTPGWRFGLWWLVVLRLMLPVLPESPFSVYNLASEAGGTAQLGEDQGEDKEAETMEWAGREDGGSRLPVALSAPSVSEVGAPVSSIAGRGDDASPTGDALEIGNGLGQVGPPVEEQSELTFAATGSGLGMDWKAWLFLGWWVGGLLVVAMMVFSYWRMRRRIVGSREVTEERLVMILAQAQKAMEVRRSVMLLEAKDAVGPALFGFWRTRLVLPKGLAEDFSDADLRHVFLHECAHLRRHDLGLNWLLALLQAVHWFNPVLWWAFRRMRSDRELACDDLALRVAGEGNSTAYGGTIVRLLERAADAGLLPGMVGIVEKHSDIKQRISLIAAFRMGTRWSVVALVLMVGLGLTLLTGAMTPERSELDEIVMRPGFDGMPERPRLSALMTELERMENKAWKSRDRLNWARPSEDGARMPVSLEQVRMWEKALKTDFDLRNQVAKTICKRCVDEVERWHLLDWERKKWQRELDLLANKHGVRYIRRLAARVQTPQVSDEQLANLADSFAIGRRLVDLRGRYLNRHPLFIELANRERELSTVEKTGGLAEWRDSVIGTYSELVSELASMSSEYERSMSLGRPLIEPLPQSDRSKAAALVGDARSRLLSSKWNRAEMLVERALELDPRSFEAYQLRRQILEAKLIPGDLPKVVEEPVVMPSVRTVASLQPSASEQKQRPRVAMMERVVKTLEQLDGKLVATRKEYLDAVRRAGAEISETEHLDIGRRKRRLSIDAQLADSMFQRVIDLARDPQTRHELLERERSEWGRMVRNFADTNDLSELRRVVASVQGGVKGDDRADDGDIRLIAELMGTQWIGDWGLQPRPGGIAAKLEPLPQDLRDWGLVLMTDYRRLLAEAADAASAVETARKKQDEGKTLAVEAGRLIESRKFNQARETLQKALAADPRGALGYRMLRRLVEARGRPEVRRVEARKRVATPKSTVEVKAMLDEVIIPEFAYDGLTLKGVMKDLVAQVRRADPKGRKLNFSVTEPPKPVKRTPGQLGVEYTIIEIKLPIFRVSLRGVLDAICRTADRPLTYDVNPDGIVFRRTNAGKSKLVARSFSIGKEPKVFKGMLRRALGPLVDDDAGVDQMLNAYLKMVGLGRGDGEILPGTVVIEVDWKQGWLTATATPDGMSVFRGAMSALEAPKAEKRVLRELPRPGQDQILRKLNSIVIPEVAYDGLTLDEVVQDLLHQARRNDPDKRGLNFMMVSGGGLPQKPVFRARPVPVLDAMGNPISAPPPVLPGRGAPGVDLGMVLINIKLPLFNLKLAQVLDAIVKTADQPIRFVVTDYAVVFEAKELTARPQMFTRVFSVDVDAVLKGMTASGDTASVAALKADPAAGNHALRKLLISAGVYGLAATNQVGQPTMLFNPANGRLMFRGTLQDMDVVEQVLELLNPGKK